MHSLWNVKLFNEYKLYARTHVIGLVFLIILLGIPTNLTAKVFSQEAPQGPQVDSSTMIILDLIPDIIFNNTFFAKGRLIESDTGLDIKNATIVFSGNGSSTLTPVVTGGVVFNDPNGVEVLHFAPGEGACAQEKEICDQTTDVGLHLLRLGVNGTITFSDPPRGVALTLQGMGTDAFFVEMSIAEPANGTSATFYAKSFGAALEIANLNIANLGGIQQIRIVNITSVLAEPYVSLSNLTAFDPLVDPAGKYQIDFQDVEKKTYDSPLEINTGFFASMGIAASNPPLTVSQVTATFEGDGTHNGTSTTVYFRTIPNILESGTFNNGQFEEEESESGIQGEESATNPISYTGSDYTSIDCATGDSDGDGLCNSWEGATGGIQFGSGTDAVTYKLKIAGDPYRGGAIVYSDPNRKDIFLELDYMEHHRPSDAAIQKVIDAFDSMGIELYVVVDEQFPHITNFGIWRDSTSNPDDLLDDFQDVKKKKGTYPSITGPGLGTNGERNPVGKSDAYVSNYLNAKAQAYHYGLFVHSILGSCGPSGHAERPGNDLIVALGCGFSGTVSGHSGTIGSADEQAGTLMHELGHNLGLRHGGFEDMNCKANYQSVMSYSRQLPYYFDLGDPWILDYSRMILPSLDEMDDSSMPELHEDSITSSPEAHPERYLVWGAPSAHGTERVVSSIGTDWDIDNDGSAFERNLSQDLNDFAIKGCGLAVDNSILRDPTEIEVGYDDWANLQFDFTPAAGSGFDGMAGPINELDAKVRLQILNQTTNVIVDSINTLTPTANVDRVEVKGSTNNAVGKGYKVIIFWGDGSNSSALEIMSDGTWGPTDHIYDSFSFFTNPHTVVAELVNATGHVIVSTNAFSISVMPRAPDAWVKDLFFWLFIAAAIIAAVLGYFLWDSVRKLRKVREELEDAKRVYLDK